MLVGIFDAPPADEWSIFLCVDFLPNIFHSNHKEEGLRKLGYRQPYNKRCNEKGTQVLRKRWNSFCSAVCDLCE